MSTSHLDSLLFFFFSFFSFFSSFYLFYKTKQQLHGLVAQAIAAMCEEFDLATTVDDYRGLFQSVNGQTNLLDVVLNAYVVRLKRESAKDHNRG